MKRPIGMMKTTNRQLMWHGILLMWHGMLLFLLGLLTGLAEQRFTNEAMGLLHTWRV
jgi:hypothetical protein